MTNWRVQGSKIYYKNQEIFIRGTNLFGFEMSDKVLLGLDHYSMYDLIHYVKKLGFNAIRVPIALETIWCFDQLPRQDKIRDPQDKNKSIKDLLLSMMWMMRDAGMIVLVNMHRLRIDLPDGRNAITSRWFSWKQNVTTQMVIDGWLKFAQVIKDVPNVILGIKNEPHDDDEGCSTWGTGNPETDWNLAAVQIVREIAKIKKDTLFLIMGIQTYNSPSKGLITSGWGQVLQGFLDHPLPKDLNYCLEMHVYGPGVRPGYYYEPGKTHQEWQKEFGDVVDKQQIPCICTEWAAPVYDSSYEITNPKICQNSCDWEYAFSDYLKKNNISNFQWAVCGSNDSGSLLKNDWDFSKANKIKMETCKKSCPNPTWLCFI